MKEKLIKNNQAVVSGIVISEFVFSHALYGENFYQVDLQVSRLSELTDVVPLLISERLVDVHQSCIGKILEAKGQFRSYNKHDNKQNHLLLSLFVREISFLSEEEDPRENTIFLDGYICKKPTYRVTPLGREITDILLAVNRPYSKSDYIPCICWGRNAKYASTLKIGSHVKLWGRIQSRKYQKRVNSDNIIDRMAFEVSAGRMEFLDDMEVYESEVAE